MKKLLFFFMLLFCSMAMQAQHFIFDRVFGTGGTIRLQGNGYAVESKLDSKSRIVTAAKQWTSTMKFRLHLIRHDHQGKLDLSFGTGGSVLLPVISPSVTPALLVLPDDKIVVFAADTNLSPQIMVMKYLNNGVPDSSFGQYGVFRYSATAYGPSSIAFNDNSSAGMYNLPSGKLVFAYRSDYYGSRSCMMRLNSNGTLDHKFGNSGVVSFSTELFKFIKLSDGNFLCIGNIGRYIHEICKVDSNGSILTCVDTAGIYPYWSMSDYFMDGIELPDKKIVLLTESIGNPQHLLKFNSDLSQDTSFGNGFFQEIDPKSLYRSIAATSSGQILLAGATNTTHRITVFNADGNIDTRFNGWGHFDYENATYNTGPRHLLVQPDGKLVISGGGTEYDTSNIFILSRMNIDVGLKVDDNTTDISGLSVFPNPALSQIKVSGIPFNQGMLCITNVNGKVLYTEDAYKEGQIIPLDMPSGLYQISVVGNKGEVQHAKFLKQ